jgi:hypothetical protein
MSDQETITFVVPANNAELLNNNFLASPGFEGSGNHEILIQRNFRSAGLAFNDAIDRSSSDLIAFVHQDIVLPKSWVSEVIGNIRHLEAADSKWGVLGCWGARRDGLCRGHIYSNGLGVLGAAFEHPAEVQTLDETVLILRKSSGLRFDESLPHFHLHGADICLEAAKRGRKNYAISAFCTHNNYPYTILPVEFYECYSYLKNKWKRYLPIQTTCIRITRFDLPMYERKLRETYLRHVRREESLGLRAHDVPELLREVDRILNQASTSH